MCVRSNRPKVQKGEADTPLLLSYWQPPADVLFYSIERCVAAFGRETVVAAGTGEFYNYLYTFDVQLTP